MVKEVATKEEFQEALSANSLVIVDFTATWCPPCRMIGPKFAEMEKDFPNVVFLKVDVDQLDDVAQDAGISAMPTFIAYKGGEKFEDLVGASEIKLKELITKLSQASG